MIYKHGTTAYKNAHLRVARQRNSAVLQQCECGKIAEHWAHIHNTDMDDPSNFIPMCYSCHWEYDQVANNQRGEGNPYSKLTVEEIIEIRAIYAKREISQKELGKIFKTTQSNISQIVNRQVWSHI